MCGPQPPLSATKQKEWKKREALLTKALGILRQLAKGPGKAK